MNRREFIQTMASLGVSLSLPMTSLRSWAQAPLDRFWVMVNAGGGWDPTSLCDPKGDAERTDGKGPVNRYLEANIRSQGNVRYAPYPESLNPDTDVLDEFFTAHAQRLLVINGIDTETNSHATGSRFVWSGQSDTGYPSLAALIAASASQNNPMPMAYISNGGYDFTDSLVSPARVSGDNNFNKMAFPNSRNGNDQDYYLDPDSFARIQQARQQSMLRQQLGAQLEKTQTSLAQLIEARSGDSGLNNLIERLPDNRSGGLRGQAEMAAAAFASGLAISANLSTGGFDTHGDHDRRQLNSLETLLEGVDHLWNELVRQGIEQQTTVVIASDFGRTPFYNSGNGKDHWNVTSLMAMGAGIEGNRVIGATNALFEAYKLNPSNLQLDDEGLYVTPAHVHKALRRMAGLSGTDLDREYGIPVEDLPLFG